MSIIVKDKSSKWPTDQILLVSKIKKVSLINNLTIHKSYLEIELGNYPLVAKWTIFSSFIPTSRILQALSYKIIISPKSFESLRVEYHQFKLFDEYEYRTKDYTKPLKNLNFYDALNIIHNVIVYDNQRK